MVEHIHNERLAALLDDGVEDASAREHLADCPACRRELDLLRRMRMALSAMDELEPPADQWRRIEGSLPAGSEPSGLPRGVRPGGDDDGEGRRSDGSEGGSGTPNSWIRDIGWLRAAAGVVLFAGGLGLGSLLGPLPGSGNGSSSGGPEEAAGGTPDRATAAATTAETATTAGGASRSERAGELEDRDTEEILRGLESLGNGDVDAGWAYRNPTQAAERLARLDALVRAAREALEEEPADPAMNHLLFRVLEERQQLNQALHLASIDYR